MTLPISSAFSGPTALNQVARGLPSSTAPTSIEIDRLVVHLAFAELHQPLDEAAEAETLGIDGSHAAIPGLQRDAWACRLRPTVLKENNAMPGTETKHKVRDVNVRMLRGGSGPPLLFLHGANGLPVWLPVFDLLVQAVRGVRARASGLRHLGQSAVDAQHRRPGDVLPRFPRRVRAARGSRGRAIARRLGRGGGRGAQLLADQDAVAAGARRHPHQGHAERRQLHLGARGRRSATSTTTRPSPIRSWRCSRPTSRPTSC